MQKSCSLHQLRQSAMITIEGTKENTRIFWDVAGNSSFHYIWKHKSNSKHLFSRQKKIRTTPPQITKSPLKASAAFYCLSKSYNSYPDSFSWAQQAIKWKGSIRHAWPAVRCKKIPLRQDSSHISTKACFTLSEQLNSLNYNKIYRNKNKVSS